MVFLCWNRPSPHHQSACLKQAGDFNYDTKYRCSTSSPSNCDPNSASSSLPLGSSSSSELLDGSNRDGFVVNRARVLLGSGLQTYQQGKRALQAWKHFGLGWAFVDPSTPVGVGERFCVCVKELVPWAVLPLQIVYVNDHDSVKVGSLKRGLKASFAFGSGTLRGHLLGGLPHYGEREEPGCAFWSCGVKPFTFSHVNSVFHVKIDHNNLTLDGSSRSIYDLVAFLIDILCFRWRKPVV